VEQGLYREASNEVLPKINPLYLAHQATSGSQIDASCGASKRDLGPMQLTIGYAEYMAGKCWEAIG
jgi:hypothetical protein